MFDNWADPVVHLLPSKELHGLCGQTVCSILAIFTTMNIFPIAQQICQSMFKILQHTK